MAYRSNEKTRQKKDAKRTAMMQAAMKVFAEKGYHSATVRDVVLASNVAIGTFYFYFPDKETLLSYLYEETADFLLQSVQQPMNGSGDFVKKAQSAVQSYVNVATYEPTIIQLLLVGGVGAVPALHEKRMQFRDRLTKSWQKLIEEGISTGQLVEQDSRIAAEFIVGGMDEVMLNLLAQSTVKTESVVADLTNSILRLTGFQG